MTDTDFARRTGDCALRAALHEAAAIGKPGLVCADAQGAHADMDIRTLFHSAVALAPYFTEAASLGLAMAEAADTALFQALRPLGCQAEKTMLAATGTINTHKGLIFSLGLVCAAAGKVHGLAERAGLAGREKRQKAEKHGSDLLSPKICAAAGALVQGIVERDFARLRQGEEPRTAGERFFAATGNAGIRGEAEAGFPHALAALKVLRSTLRQTMSPHTPAGDFNTACLEALLTLMSTVPDTTVWHRGGQEGLQLLSEGAARALRHHIHSPQRQQAMQELRQLCLARRLSPGGSADLLAVAIFLYFSNLLFPASVPPANFSGS